MSRVSEWMNLAVPEVKLMDLHCLTADSQETASRVSGWKNLEER